MPRSPGSLLLTLGAGLLAAVGCSSGSDGAAGEGLDTAAPASSSAGARPAATAPQQYADAFQELADDVDDAVDRALADAQPAEACVELREQELAGWVTRLGDTPRDAIDEVNRYLVLVQELLAACRDGAAQTDALRGELSAATAAVRDAATG